MYPRKPLASRQNSAQLKIAARLSCAGSAIFRLKSRPCRKLSFPPQADALSVGLSQVLISSSRTSGQPWRPCLAQPSTKQRGRISCINRLAYSPFSALWLAALVRSIQTALGWERWAGPRLVPPPTTTLQKARLRVAFLALSQPIRACAADRLTAKHRPAAGKSCQQAVRGIPRVAFCVARPAKRRPRRGGCSKRS